jgi:hypothetical protein
MSDTSSPTVVFLVETKGATHVPAQIWHLIGEAGATVLRANSLLREPLADPYPEGLPGGRRKRTGKKAYASDPLSA